MVDQSNSALSWCAYDPPRAQSHKDDAFFYTSTVTQFSGQAPMHNSIKACVLRTEIEVHAVGGRYGPNLSCFVGEIHATLKSNNVWTPPNEFS